MGSELGTGNASYNQAAGKITIKNSITGEQKEYPVEGKAKFLLDSMVENKLPMNLFVMKDRINSPGLGLDLRQSQKGTIADVTKGLQELSVKKPEIQKRVEDTAKEIANPKVAARAGESINRYGH